MLCTHSTARLISPLAFCLAVSFASSVVVDAVHAEQGGQPPKVVVLGTAKVTRPNDYALVQLSIESRAPERAAALAENGAKTDRILNALRASNIRSETIRTLLLYTNELRERAPNDREYGPNTGPVIGYLVTHVLEFRADDPPALTRLLDTVLRSGDAKLNSIDFRVERSREMLDEARVLAVADARRKAMQLATATDARLGPVRLVGEPSALEIGTGRYQEPDAAFDRVALPPQPDLGPALRLLPGESSVTVHIKVEWDSATEHP